MRLLDWSCEYHDGVCLKEGENEFSEIQKDKLKYFNLRGAGVSFIHEIETGIYRINQNNVHLLLDDQTLGKTYNVLTYKKKREILNSDKSGIIAYYIGFQEEWIIGLFYVDMLEHKIKFLLKINPKMDTHRFSMIINGFNNERVLEFDGTEKEFLFEL